MAYITTQGNEILVNTGESAGADAQQTPSNELVGWVIGRLDSWERIRDQEHAADWKEYWTKFRGKWNEADTTRKSERSKIITPALAQAIEMTVAEVEEALFSRERWIDVADDVADPDKADIAKAVDLLLEDIELVNGKEALSEGVLNAAIFGTGVIKVCTDVWGVKKPKRTKFGTVESSETPRVVVYWESIRADEFIPDPSGRTIQEMLGCGHRTRRPLHSVLEKIERGIYLESALSEIGAGPLPKGNEVDSHERAGLSAADVDEVVVDEYHGKIPAKFLLMLDDAGTASGVDDILRQDIEERPDDGDGPLVEAIVTIANGSTLLRAIANPFVMKDRSIVAWAHEKVPGRFHGRGVAEKGINAQRGLDAEVRARNDALGFISAPMLAFDQNRMPKGFRKEIFPGKTWPTNGNPAEIMTPIKIGEINAATFNQAQEMERMVQMATGAFDTSVALGRGQTSSGGNAATSGSLFMGAFVKRSRRAIQSLCRNAVYPLIEKTLWRYMEFDSKRYPTDVQFVVKTALGVVAREVEQLNLTQVMAMLPEDVPGVTVAVAKGIIELANLHNKAEIMAAMDAAMQPPTPEQQKQKQQAEALVVETQLEELRNLKGKTTKLLAEVRELLTSAEVNSRRADVEGQKVRIEQQRTDLMREENEQFAVQNDISEQRLELQKEALDHKMAQDSKKSS